MNALDLLQAHRYPEAIAAYRERIALNPEDYVAIGGLGLALQAIGAYAEALPLLERVDEKRRSDLRGSPGCRHEIAYIRWCLGERDEAIGLMRSLVDGILDRSIQYADPAGGVQQGLLLHYMAVTVSDEGLKKHALDYLRHLSKKSKIKWWPGPVAFYILDEKDFTEILQEATKQPTLKLATRTAEEDILHRRRLCVALFHDGVKYRTEGQEKQCLERMKECFALKNPLVEPEWYLAQYEVEQAGGGAVLERPSGNIFTRWFR